MKFLLVLLMLSFFSTAALAERCVRDSKCQVESPGGISCFVVVTGTDHTGANTCRMQCVDLNIGALCIKNKYRPLGKCVDLRLDYPYSWQPEDS